ncbi:12957_t:CDS:1 [Gigaspora margarita]|uniref:12957_t:CDS:1 n=1 Tax=Gigaspora margarita TaxID=4874 RepID=A0ABN7WWF1_GIGMA|nr:12957_t:CDS:1 [Gigaspora margarita]
MQKKLKSIEKTNPKYLKKYKISPTQNHQNADNDNKLQNIMGGDPYIDPKEQEPTLNNHHNNCHSRSIPFSTSKIRPNKNISRQSTYAPISNNKQSVRLEVCTSSKYQSLNDIVHSCVLSDNTTNYGIPDIQILCENSGNRSDGCKSGNEFEIWNPMNGSAICNFDILNPRNGSDICNFEECGSARDNSKDYNLENGSNDHNLENRSNGYDSRTETGGIRPEVHNPGNRINANNLVNGTNSHNLRCYNSGNRFVGYNLQLVFKYYLRVRSVIYKKYKLLIWNLKRSNFSPSLICEHCIAFLLDCIFDLS